MSAKIIQFRKPRDPDVGFGPVFERLAKQRARRGLALTDQGRSIIARLNRGEVVTDLGQIDQPTRRLLKRWLDKGYVYRGQDFSFPITKTCWAGARFYDVPEGEQSPAIPLNIKFREL